VRASVPFCDLSRAARIEAAGLSDAFRDVLAAGRFVLGPAVSAFEEAFARSVGVRFGVGCASGTDALTLALAALGVGPGDEVVTVSMTCAPTVTGILRSGATPVLVDVDDETLTLDPLALEEAVGARTKAIVPVHLHGRPAPMGEILDFARRHGLFVVEDAAQAHGASLDGRPVGSFGDAAAWSFYPTKNLGALGDGGMVTTDDAAVADRLRRLRVYGYTTRDDAEEPGLNSRLDELQAAFLLHRLGRLPAANERRAVLASFYDARLAGVARLPAPPGGARPCHHLYVVRVPGRDLVRGMLAERGIGTEVHYPRAVHQQKAFERLVRGPLPVTEKAVGEILSLPLYPELTDGEAERVAEELIAVVEELRGR
jgi:dTDP-4-amino-4,6-dideoxygalactose transaminase